MEENNSIIPYQKYGLLPRVTNSLEITKKLLAKDDEKLIPYRKGKKWGFCNIYKEIIIDCIYEEVKPFQFNRAIVCKNQFFWGIIDRNGTLLCDMKYERIENFSEGLAEVYIYSPKPDRRKKYGFINLNGEEAIPLVYDKVKRFSEGLAMVELNGKRGFIDYQGNIVIDFRYVDDYDSGDDGYVFNEGLCRVCINFLKIGFINKAGNVIVEFGKYKYMRSFSEGLAAVAKELPSDWAKEFPSNDESENNIWGFIDNNGNEVIKCNYEGASSFSEGLAIIVKNGKIGFINSKGLVVIPCIYENGMPFSEGFAVVKNWVSGSRTEPAKYRWGCIDKSGKVIIPFISEDNYGIYGDGPSHCSFSNGMLRVKIDEKVGYVDVNGDFLMQCNFEYGWSFKDDLAWVKTSKGETYIDKDGNEYFENLKT